MKGYLTVLAEAALITLLLDLSVVTTTLVAESKRQFSLPALNRADFNRLAIQANLPLHWAGDRNKNLILEPDELKMVGIERSKKPWVRNNRFTKHFQRVYRKLVDARRREFVRQELSRGEPTLISTDLSSLNEGQKRMVRELIKASALIDELFQRQLGSHRFRSLIPQMDPESRALFLRNRGPWCVHPRLSRDPLCGALITFPERRSENYPASTKQDQRFCDLLTSRGEGKNLLDPFHVVRRKGGKWIAVPFSMAYVKEMREISKHLGRAARSIERDRDEQALFRYLRAASAAFLNNDWEHADEYWAAMNSANSKWYLRVAPDEVYYEPCNQKAGFALVLARIDPASKYWKKTLLPLRPELEQEFAALIGPPYSSGKAEFTMPDFVRIVLNAGDARSPIGATLGQTLPNWGRIANKGRRTMVMVNIVSHPSFHLRMGKISRRFVSGSWPELGQRDRKMAPLGTILHEVGHNLGPGSDYLLKGKPAKAIFGGALASIMEELKAVLSSYWLGRLLFERKILSQQSLHQLYRRNIVWSISHLSRGMNSASGSPLPYSQLSAVCLKHFLDGKALVQDGETWRIDFGKIDEVVERLFRRVGQIKAKGDKPAAVKLVQDSISEESLKKLKHEQIRAYRDSLSSLSFYYGVNL